ncbi:MAG: hypothetical protein K6E19_04540 [Lachnospiraceae bacterium]|nr:hypothetical protein [Lachnospiraceae bacterium]
MRKTTKLSKQIIKAITIGLSASILMQPVSTVAETDDGSSSENGNSINQSSEDVNKIAEAKEAVDAADSKVSETIEGKAAEGENPAVPGVDDYVLSVETQVTTVLTQEQKDSIQPDIDTAKGDLDGVASFIEEAKKDLNNLSYDDTLITTTEGTLDEKINAFNSEVDKAVAETETAINGIVEETEKYYTDKSTGKLTEEGASNAQTEKDALVKDEHDKVDAATKAADSANTTASEFIREAESKKASLEQDAKDNKDKEEAAKQAVDKANEAIQAARDSYATADQAYKAAEDNFDEVSDKLQAIKDKYNALIQAKATEVIGTDSEIGEIDKLINEAQAKLNALLNEQSAAQDALRAAKEAVDTAETNYKNAIEQYNKDLAVYNENVQGAVDVLDNLGTTVTAIGTEVVKALKDTDYYKADKAADAYVENKTDDTKAELLKELTSYVDPEEGENVSYSVNTDSLEVSVTVASADKMTLESSDSNVVKEADNVTTTYTFDAENKTLVKEVKGNVTTTTYTGASLSASATTYSTEAEAKEAYGKALLAMFSEEKNGETVTYDVIDINGVPYTKSDIEDELAKENCDYAKLGYVADDQSVYREGLALSGNFIKKRYGLYTTTSASDMEHPDRVNKKLLNDYSAAGNYVVSIISEEDGIYYGEIEERRNEVRLGCDLMETPARIYVPGAKDGWSLFSTNMVFAEYNTSWTQHSYVEDGIVYKDKSKAQILGLYYKSVNSVNNLNSTTDNFYIPIVGDTISFNLNELNLDELNLDNTALDKLRTDAEDGVLTDEDAISVIYAVLNNERETARDNISGKAAERNFYELISTDNLRATYSKTLIEGKFNYNDVYNIKRIQYNQLISRSADDGFKQVDTLVNTIEAYEDKLTGAATTVEGLKNILSEKQADAKKIGAVSAKITDANSKLETLRNKKEILKNKKEAAVAAINALEIGLEEDIIGTKYTRVYDENSKVDLPKATNPDSKDKPSEDSPKPTSGTTPATDRTESDDDQKTENTANEGQKSAETGNTGNGQVTGNGQTAGSETTDGTQGTEESENENGQEVIEGNGTGDGTVTGGTGDATGDVTGDAAGGQAATSVVEMEDEGTAKAPAPTIEMEDEGPAKAPAPILEMPEEDVPLSSLPEADNMNIAWLLLVVALGTTGAEMYRRHLLKKKAKKND